MSDDLVLMPPIDDGGDDLSSLLRDRAPKARSKFTTTLVVVLVLLVGVLVGIPIGQSTGGDAAQVPGGGAGLPVPEADGNASSTGPGPMVAGPTGPATTGIIEDVEGSTLTITRDDGTVLTVTTTDQTQAAAYAQLDIEALEPGTAIMVVGTEGEDGSIAADRIVIGDPRFGLPRP